MFNNLNNFFITFNIKGVSADKHVEQLFGDGREGRTVFEYLVV